MPRRPALLLVLGLACTKSPDPSVKPPAGGHAIGPDAAKGTQVNSYLQADAVTAVNLSPAGAIDDFAGSMLAYAPDGKTWASAWASGARVFQGDRETASAQFAPDAATAVDFAADGATLHVGLHDLDVATGKVTPPTANDPAPWAKAAGLPAPPTLGLTAARTPQDGSLVIAAATGVTRDRRRGVQRPASGDEDWIFALDPTTRQPTHAMWHGVGVHSVFAISAQHVAAAGLAPAKVFDRQDLTRPIDLVGSPVGGVTALAWSPDGALLAAAGGTRITLWRAGAWDTPVASWEVGAQYHSSLAFHPTRPVLTAGNRDGHVRCYGVADADLGNPPLLLDHDARGQVDAVAFSPSGTTLLAIAVGPARQILRFDLALTP